MNNNNKYMIVTDQWHGTRSYMMGYEKNNGLCVLHEVAVDTLKNDIDNDNHKRAYRNGAELFSTREKATAAMNEILRDINEHIAKEDADNYLQFNPHRFIDCSRIVRVVGASR